MDSIGQILRRAREERGLSLDEVAARTRINRKYLESIERDDHSSIPGGFFYKSFIRQYAGILEITGQIEKILAAQEPVASAVPDEHILKSMAEVPRPNRPARPSLPAWAYVGFLILAVAGSTGLYMWWHRMQQAPAPSETVQTPAPAPRQKAQPVVQQPVVQPVAHQPDAAPSPAPGPGEFVLDIEATEATWFELRSDGKTVFSGVLKPGESKTISVKSGARMKVGNAGGIEVKFNGKPIGIVGTRGQIRTVLFSPSGAEVVKPAGD